MHIKTKVSRLFSTNPTIHGLLKQAPDVRTARNFAVIYIEETRRMLNRESQRQQPLEWELQTRSLQAFRKFLSIRSERLAQYSIIRLLWMLAHEKFDELPDDLNDGFFEEMTQLFLGILGTTGIYAEEPYPELVDKTGREAAELRSDQLDKIAKKCLDRANQYTTGLDANIIQLRQRNRKHILSSFSASESDWSDYKWHLKHVLRNTNKLSALIRLTAEEIKAINLAKKNKLPFGITPYYVSLMDRETHRKRDHAVRAQVIPPLNYVKKMVEHRDDHDHSFDFMLESDTSPIDLITRRYPMIVILKPYNTCSQICVYCQRNWEIEDCLADGALAPQEKIDAAIQWIKDRPGIQEVLVTGGDPLVMPDEQVDRILGQLANIKHVERIRIGSRTPVVLPMRITDSLMDVISKYHEPGLREIVLVTHFSHTYEVTPEAQHAVQQFRKRGISVYNQAVFTVENSRRFEMVALRRALRKIGVDPYYTFNTKGKEETKSYRVPLSRLRQEIKEEARLIPGLVRMDEAVYNVPGLGKNYLRAMQHHSLLTVLPNGRRVYEFHPWEKNLSLAQTYVDVDVSITDYLNELKRRGENKADYKTIWYYF